MKVYKRKAGSPFKWIFGGILFVLAMSFTMTEVYGFNYPYQSGHGSSTVILPDPQQHSYQSDASRSVVPDDHPGEVPEPATLLLLAGGLGLAALKRNRQLESK